MWAGLGYHISELDASRAILLYKLIFIGEAAYGFMMATIKLSLLMLYYRLLRVAFQASKTMRVSLYTIAAATVIQAIIFFFTTLFVCNPIEKNWRPDVPGHCYSMLVPWTVGSVMSIVTDVAILILPIPQIWQTRLGLVEKIGVTLTLATGCLYVSILSRAGAPDHLFGPSQLGPVLGSGCSQHIIH